MPNVDPNQGQPRLRTSAWCSAGPATEVSLLGCCGQIDEVNPCWYRLGFGIGDPLLRHPQPNAGAWIAARRATGVKVVPTVQDVGKQLTADAIFKKPGLRDQLVEGIVAEVDALGLDGIDIDFETTMQAAHFSSFMADLASELHARGKLLSAALWPKTEDRMHPSHDYAALGACVDEVKIMLYPGAGPVGALPELRSFLTYAVKHIERAKLYAGFNLFGFDKSSVVQVTLTQSAGDALAIKRGMKPELQATAGELYFAYISSKGLPHDVWYVDGPSIAMKCDLASQFKLAGIALWQLGGEKADVWAAIKKARWGA